MNAFTNGINRPITPYKVTLKYRAHDRYVSAVQDLSVSKEMRQAIQDEGEPSEIEHKYE